MRESSTITTFLFTDIEGSSRLWEQRPDEMRDVVAKHDAIVRSAIDKHRGTVVKMTGDGVHAAFVDPLDAVAATIDLQQSLAVAETAASVSLRVRCGIHAGVVEHRAGDYFGTAVNRAARLMSAAHGGQILLSQVVAGLVRDRLPEHVRLRDLGPVRLRDLASAEHVFQVVHADLPGEFPPLRSLESSPNNLPQRVTSFVGRARELQDVSAMLARSRLVTLLGIGGIGKTSLALQVAADVLDEYPDGVWLVELAPLNDPKLVSQAVASALGVKEEPGRPVLEALVQYSRDKRLLIILDNCEHVIETCADIAHGLLQAGPHVRILASSREVLRVGGEATYSVPALAIPRSEQRQMSEVSMSPAVRLFVERACEAQSAFHLTAENAAAIAAICTRLDGIPLALELAAARVRGMSVVKIAERLGDRFRVLTGGRRTALPHHQTLRASIDWSYDLLSQHERIVLRRLAVFAGGFTLEAAEQVCTGSEISPELVLDLLAKLVDKSLVELLPETGRYRLLDTVREYAQERLAESGESDDARGKHLLHYVAFAERARSELRGHRHASALAGIDADLENVLAAHAWCGETHDGAEAGFRLSHAMKPYWLNRGLLGLGYRLTNEALRHSQARAPTVARCKGLADAGQLAFFLGRYADAQTSLQESLAIARSLEDNARIEAVLQPLGMACLGQGNVMEARGHLEEAVSLARDLGNARELAGALNALGQLHRMDDNLDGATALYDEALALARSLGEAEIVAIGLLNLSMTSVTRGELACARNLLLEVLAIARSIDSKPAVQSVLEVSAGLAAARADWSNAAQFFGAAEALVAQTGLHRDPVDEAFLAPRMVQVHAMLGAARFAGARDEGLAWSFDAALDKVMAWLQGATD